MAENFTVYSFQLKADDFTKFYGAGYDDNDFDYHYRGGIDDDQDQDTYSEELNGGFEKHVSVSPDDTNDEVIAIDQLDQLDQLGQVDQDDVFKLPDEDSDIFQLPEEDVFELPEGDIAFDIPEL